MNCKSGKYPAQNGLVCNTKRTWKKWLPNAYHNKNIQQQCPESLKGIENGHVSTARYRAVHTRFEERRAHVVCSVSASLQRQNHDLLSSSRIQSGYEIFLLTHSHLLMFGGGTCSNKFLNKPSSNASRDSTVWASSWTVNGKTSRAIESDIGDSTNASWVKASSCLLDSFMIPL